MILEQPTTEMFRYEKHGAGAAGYAAKRIANGEIVSFDIWQRILDDSQFLTVRREFVKKVFIGLCELDGEPEGKNVALRVSHIPDMEAHQSHSLIASWNGVDIAKDAVFIAAEIVSFMGCQGTNGRSVNYFIND